MAAPVDPPAYRKHDPPPTLRYEDYTIGWISALPEEAEAATHMLDDRDNGRFPFRPGDDNQYTPGEIAGHKVVIACLPKRTTGTVSAATLVSQMRQSFPNLRYGLMVGIGAGVPGQNLDPDIRLGDVVVASPSDISDSPVGVIGYELGAETVDGFKRRDWQAPTDRRLRNALESIERDARVEGSHDFLQHLKIFVGRNHGQKFRHPDVEDQLYKGDDTDELVPRQPRLPQDPAVHYGLIASGNKLVKKAELRDALRDKYGIICFEMEAAGLMNIMPVAVIRGVSDYADSRKNDVWHCYAAATAAAYAKGLLNVIGPESPARNDLGRGVEPPGDRVRVLKRLRVNGVGFLRRCGDGVCLCYYLRRGDTNHNVMDNLGYVVAESVGSEYVEFVDAFVYGRVRVNIAGYMDYSRIKVEDL